MLRKLWSMLTENDIEAGKHPVYTDVVPMRLRGDRLTVFGRVRRAFEQGGDRWTVVSQDTREGRLVGTVTTALFRFVDDFSVRLEPVEPATEPEEWLVKARSRSRIGMGDFGKNARNLREFYSRLSDVKNSAPEDD